ncbi:MAG: TerC/Alx family metal homeostasis membrane protein, partial [Parachlamydiaceae bacterium]|nr:TerC/Alx family metal homeostasis membrane protein [Parachlamydiaceae bacterium]
MAVTNYHWFTFLSLIAVIITYDLWRFYRSPHIISMREAIYTSIGWIFLAFAFNGWILYRFGYEHALDFFTGYLLEKSLSVDNLFVFLLLFSYFKVPEKAKHQVLFYGVLGAIVMRALLIWGGLALIENFNWMFIVFGVFLIFTGFKLIKKQEKEIILEERFLYRTLKKYIPFTPHFHESFFFIKEKGKWIATPLFILLIMIELTDLIFALDSIPAILGITTEPFIVFTSNIFAILGLRALFFVLEGFMQSFYLLHYALAFILIYIGCKMMLIYWIHIPTWITL